MRISNLLPVLCALAVGANCLTVRAEDTPAQAAARAALAKQLFEAGAQQPSAANSATAKTAASDVTMTPVNDKAAKAKAKADQAAAAAKARQEAAQAAADLKLQKEAENKIAAQRAAEAKAAKEQAEAKAKADKAAATTSVKPEDDQKLAAQRAALAAALANRLAAEAPTKSAPPAKPDQMAPAAKPVAKPLVATAPQPAVSQPAKPVAADFAGKDLGMQPIAAPAMPIANDKQERLQALLGKYKADQISPEEYFKQRAAILAEP